MTKNIFSVKFLSLIIAISSILLVGCDKNEDKKSLDLRIVESQLYFEPTGGEGSIIIEAEPESVISVESSTGWCRFISSEYQDENRYKITIQTIRNAALTARSALLTISDGKTSQDVVATQSGTIFYTDEDYERRFDNKKQWLLRDIGSEISLEVLFILGLISEVLLKDPGLWPSNYH